MDNTKEKKSLPEKVCEPETGYNSLNSTPKQGRHTGKLNTAQALKLKLRGMSYRDIGKLQGVDKTTVRQAVVPLLDQFADAKQLAEYKQHSADVFHAVAMKTLQTITSSDYEKAGLRDKIVAAGICTDKARLIEGASTSNVAVSILQGIPDPLSTMVNSTLTAIDNDAE